MPKRVRLVGTEYSGSGSRGRVLSILKVLPDGKVECIARPGGGAAFVDTARCALLALGNPSFVRLASKRVGILT